MTKQIMQPERLSIVVGIATLARRDILTKTIDFLAHQTRLPDRLVICPVEPDDVDSSSLDRFPAPTLMVKGTIGSCAQRNLILSTAERADIVVFFDDDFFADRNYLANLEKIFLANADVVATTGCLLADGATGPGLSVEQGQELAGVENPAADNSVLIDCYGTYGCNMAFRMETIRQNDIRFDENLPLYGWQEDIDFSLRVAAHGRIVRTKGMRGVHLGVKLGRTSGVRFGYSQIANPVYLVRKGTMSLKHAMKLIGRNAAANLVRSFHPEPWIDRKGRLKGNFLALIDTAAGRVTPNRILQLD
jgi:GT2 family glycosyltransferase